MPIEYDRRLEVVWYSEKKVGNINACMCNNNSDGRIEKKDDLVIVEGSDKLHDQWSSHDAIFHL